MIRPALLKKGMTVALTAPSGALVNPETLPDYTRFLQERGYRVVIGESCRQSFGYLAGEDRLRAEELNRLFRDPSVDAIFCARGGYGTARILELLDYEMIRDHPKIFAGFSDITALHTAINRYASLMTFHSPNGDMASGREGCEQSWQWMEALLSGKTAGQKLQNPSDMPAECVVPGKAEGLLTGGNLTVLSHSLGTPYTPVFDGKLLFLEDVNEPVYKIDEMLTQLRLSGAFERCSGVVFGLFVRALNKLPEYAFSVRQVIDQIVSPAGRPVFMNLCCGHAQPMLTLPMGMRCRMDAEAGSIEMLE